MNVICDKYLATISVQEEKLKAFPLKFGVRQGPQLSLLLFNTLFEVSTRRTMQDKDKETGLEIGMREVR